MIEARSDSKATRGRYALFGALAAFGVLSLPFAKLSLFVMVGSFLAWASLKKSEGRALGVLTLVAGVSSATGFVRFLMTEAMPGIVQGGTIASNAAAVSRLREILFGQDALRQQAFIDPDGDKVGSAGFLGELTGATPLRSGAPLAQPVLERYPGLVETALGPAMEIAGYYYIVCLPTPGGGFTARPGDPVDDEAAERRFVAYAWPATADRGLVDSYFIDEHERILFARDGAPKGSRQRLGAEHPPACDDALSPSSRERWQVWRGKRPRTTLPGDRQ